MAALPNLRDDATFFPRLQRLVECLCAELAKSGGPELCYCGLMVGDITPIGLMSCDDNKGCGVAYVRPIGAYASSTFPTPDEGTLATCASPLAMEVVVGVARCYPRMAGRAAVPDPQAMFEATRLYMSDMQAIRRAISCCFGKKTPGQPNSIHTLGGWSPIPAGAGVSGGEWQVFIGAD